MKIEIILSSLVVSKTESFGVKITFLPIKSTMPPKTRFLRKCLDCDNHVRRPRHVRCSECHVEFLRERQISGWKSDGLSLLTILELLGFRFITYHEHCPEVEFCHEVLANNPRDYKSFLRYMIGAVIEPIGMGSCVSNCPISGIFEEKLGILHEEDYEEIKDYDENFPCIDLKNSIYRSTRFMLKMVELYYGEQNHDSVVDKYNNICHNYIL